MVLVFTDLAEAMETELAPTVDMVAVNLVGMVVAVMEVLEGILH